MNNKYELTQNPRMKSVLDFLGVTLIVVPHGVNPAITLWNSSEYEKDITKVFDSDGSDVYRNVTAFPRFGLFYDVRFGIPDKDALIALKLQSLDFRKSVIIAESADIALESGTGSASFRTGDVNSMVFDVETNKPAIFYLSDSYDSGWHASVNGREIPIYRANYNFRAVLVPAGSMVVRFWYLPASVVIGAWVSGGGLCITIGIFLVQYIQRRRK